MEDGDKYVIPVDQAVESNTEVPVDDAADSNTVLVDDAADSQITTLSAIEPAAIEMKTASSLERAVKHRKLTRLGKMTMRDHFSLSNPSSTVAFAEDESILLVDNLEQVVLEKKKDEDHITAKQATVSSAGLMLLRSVYTLVATLVSGLLFIFCIQLVLFLFLGLAIESGKKNCSC